MTKDELANLLDGREYGDEITENNEIIAKESGLVVVFGYSDDNVEIRGAINDEIGAFEGTEINIDHKGVVPDCECDCECRKCLSEWSQGIKTIHARWDYEGYSWFIELPDVECATFEILEHTEDDGTTKFCRGIVFNISDL